MVCKYQDKMLDTKGHAVTFGFSKSWFTPKIQLSEMDTLDVVFHVITNKFQRYLNIKVLI